MHLLKKFKFDKAIRIVLLLSLVFINSNHANAVTKNKTVLNATKKRYHTKKQRYSRLKMHKRSVLMSSKYRGRFSDGANPPLRPNLKTTFVTAQPIMFSAYSGTLLNSQVNKKLLKVSPYEDPREFPNNSQNAFNTPFGQVDWPEVANSMFIRDNKFYSHYKGFLLELTLTPKLQDAAQKYLITDRIINGSTVIIEPKTGRILAMTQAGGARNAIYSVSSRAPAASLIKIVTASATIEKFDLIPTDEIYFRGGCGVLKNDNWLADPSRDNQRISFSHAFGSSCNTAFARLALYNVGLSSLRSYSEKFMFNRPIPSDVKMQTSMFLLPDPDTATPQEVAEAGAGFGATKLNPIHAALLSATINNKGIMMAPYLVENAFDSDGKIVYKAHPQQIGRVIQAQTALRVETLMLATISSGTSRRAFRRSGTRFDLDEIGGKTGTLLDPENRQVLYTWFSGIAPLSSPNSIAIGTVVASWQNWVVRASSVAQTTLADFFRIERSDESRVVRRN